MKKGIAIAVLLAAACIVSAQTKDKLDGFWSIPWGSSISTVEGILKDKGCTIFNRGPEYLMAQGRYTNQDVVIALSFFKNQFSDAIVIYKYEINRAFQKYDEMCSLISSKYGEPTSRSRWFKTPYEDGDGYEEQAIKLNKGHVSSTWVFGDGNTISTYIVDNLDVFVDYCNTELDNKSKAARDAKSADDL